MQFHLRHSPLLCQVNERLHFALDCLALLLILYDKLLEYSLVCVVFLVT